jgi:hypothetical protein
MPLQGGLGVERMCQLAQVSRAGFYRYLRGTWPAEEEINLQSAVQDVVLEHRRRYGYRRVTAHLRFQTHLRIRLAQLHSSLLHRSCDAEEFLRKKHEIGRLHLGT